LPVLTVTEVAASLKDCAQNSSKNALSFSSRLSFSYRFLFWLTNDSSVIRFDMSLTGEADADFVPILASVQSYAVAYNHFDLYSIQQRGDHAEIRLSYLDGLVSL